MNFSSIRKKSAFLLVAGCIAIQNSIILCDSYSTYDSGNEPVVDPKFACILAELQKPEQPTIHPKKFDKESRALCELVNSLEACPACSTQDLENIKNLLNSGKVEEYKIIAELTKSIDKEISELNELSSQIKTQEFPNSQTDLLEELNKKLEIIQSVGQERSRIALKFFPESTVSQPLNNSEKSQIKSVLLEIRIAFYYSYLYSATNEQGKLNRNNYESFAAQFKRLQIKYNLSAKD